MRQTMTVEMDDGTTYSIEADGRDVRAWESEYGRSFMAETISFTSVAQLAYLAGRRTGVLNGQWPDYDTFNAHCVDARGRPVRTVADPTPPGRTDDSSVSSPTDSARSPRKSRPKGRP